MILRDTSNTLEGHRDSYVDSLKIPLGPSLYNPEDSHWSVVNELEEVMDIVWSL